MVQEGIGSYENLLGRKIKIKGAAELVSYVEKAPSNCKGVICIVSTSWCPPCRALAGHLEQTLAAGGLQRYMIVYVDGDEDGELNLSLKTVRSMLNYSSYPSNYMFAPGNATKYQSFRLNETVRGGGDNNTVSQALEAQADKFSRMVQ